MATKSADKRKKKQQRQLEYLPRPLRKKENLPSRLAGSSRLNSGGALISIWRAEQGRRGDPGENGDDEFLMLASCTTKRNSQMDVAPVEQDQGLMKINSSDCSGDGASCENETNYTDHGKQSNELGHARISVTGGGYFHQLLAEHTIISEAFLSAATYSWFEKEKDLLSSQLSSLKRIWSQPQWQACLKHLCCHGEFRSAVLKIIKIFEEELSKCREETNMLHQPDQISHSTLMSLVSLIIPPLLKLIRFVHALWMDGAVLRFPEELIEARKMKNVDQILRFRGETLEFLDVWPEELEEGLAQWLQLIRESGYNLLGLCATIKGAFSELLDNSSINNAIMENIRSMEIRHLTKLIDLVIVPFIKHCPHNLWVEWMLKLLLPLFDYCGDVLYYSWFSLLHNGQANVPLFFGYICGSEETVSKMENYLLLDLTRKVSKLLGALASQELNQGVYRAGLVLDMNSASHDFKCTPSTSLVGLSMNLFGCWVDGEAAIDSIPFCHSLVQVAVATNNEKLKRFIKDDMLPAIIRRLYDDLPCAVQKTIRKLSPLMNSINCRKATKDLLVLCQEIYKVYIRCQNLEGEDQDTDNIAYWFDDWLTKQKKELCVKASYAIPDEFPATLWNWEFEEEFQRYLPTYLDVLHEVDTMDCQECCCLDSAKIFENLSLEFRSRHGVRSHTDHRKMPGAYSEQRADRISKWACELIKSKPYIKLSNGWNNAMNRLKENFVINVDTKPDAIDAVNIFYNSILLLWEPQFHPLIREGQMDVLVEIAHQLAFAEERKNYEPLEPDSLDFLDHLQPYAKLYIYRKKTESGYFTAIEQVQLHKEFDRYLASGVLDGDICKFSSFQDDFIEEFADKHIAKSQFVQLDRKLITLSLEQRAQILEKQRQINTYAECLRNILTDLKLKDGLQSLMSELEVEGFFDVNNNCTDWEKGCFLRLIDNFEDLVFRGHCFPRYLVIQGIMVVEVLCDNWRQDLTQIWMETRYYEGLYYDVLRKPLKKIFMRKIEASEL
uniref:Exportin-5 C-terminal domain-containing protein n=1 Tax=Oryza rufipogon TaxID=4529 RepID=A0A0E0R902_ORYRU